MEGRKNLIVESLLVDISLMHHFLLIFYIYQIFDEGSFLILLNF